MYSRTIDVVEPVLVSAVWVDPLDSPLGPNPIDPYWVLTFNMVGRTITINIPEAAFGGGGGGGGGRAIINNSDIPLYLRMKGAPPIDQGTKDYYAKFRSIEEIQLPALESALNSEVNAGAIALAAPASVSLGEWLASSFATGGVEGLAATAMVTVGIPVLLMTILSGDSERPDNMEIAQNMVRAEALAQEQAAQAAEYERTRYRRAQWHHIATFYGYIGLQNALMFQYAGMDIKSDPNNLMYMLDHFGGHTLSYRTEVNRRLREAVTPYVNHKWLYRDALTRTLNDLRFEILSGGLKLYKR